MTLPTTGPLRASAIQTEFGGSNPIQINEYYRGGANVPNIGTTGNIPTSGIIKFSQFRGSADQIPSTIFTLVANIGGGGGFTYTGYVPPDVGSLSPTSYAGYPVQVLYSSLSQGVRAFTLALSPITNNNPPQNIFTTIQFTDSQSVARTFNSSSASFVPSDGGSVATWSWIVSYDVFLSGGHYSLSFS